MFLLTASSAAAVLPPIRSRCVSFAVAPVSPEQCAHYCAAQGVDKKTAALYSELFDGHIGTVLAAAQDEARARQNTLERAFLDAQAGLLAESLVEGVPCPVCGSTHHPARALLPHTAPTQAQVEAARQTAAEADRQAQNASGPAAKPPRTGAGRCRPACPAAGRCRHPASGRTGEPQDRAQRVCGKVPRAVVLKKIEKFPADQMHLPGIWFIWL